MSCLGYNKTTNINTNRSLFGNNFFLTLDLEICSNINWISIPPYVTWELHELETNARIDLQTLNAYISVLMVKSKAYQIKSYQTRSFWSMTNVSQKGTSPIIPRHYLWCSVLWGTVVRILVIQFSIQTIPWEIIAWLRSGFIEHLFSIHDLLGLLGLDNI